jgi:hypothetical protein
MSSLFAAIDTRDSSASITFGLMLVGLFSLFERAAGDPGGL